MGKYIRRALYLLPFFVSFYAYRTWSFTWAAMSIFVVFGLVSIIPFCKGHENLWIFLMLSYTLIPVNIMLLRRMHFYLYYPDLPVLREMFYVEYLLVLSSIEEIFGQFAGRLLWPRQYKVVIPVWDYDDEEDD